MKNLFQKLLLIAVFFFLSAISAQAAVTGNSAVTPQTPKAAVVQFLQGTDVALTYKALYTGGANGSIIKGIYVTGNDPSATHLLTCEYVSGAVNYGGVAITVPTTTPGYANAVGAINLMSPTNWPGLPLDSDGNPYLFVNNADVIKCTFATALTSTDKINLVAVVADF